MRGPGSTVYWGLPFPPLPFPSSSPAQPLTLPRSSPQIQLGSLRERCKLPQKPEPKSNFVHFSLKSIICWAPCGLRGCKNGPAPFPGRMSYKATKPGLVFLFYILACFYCVSVYYGPFLCIVSFHCYVFCLLVVLVKLSLFANCYWQERPL